MAARLQRHWARMGRSIIVADYDTDSIILHSNEPGAHFNGRASSRCWCRPLMMSGERFGLIDNEEFKVMVERNRLGIWPC